MATKEKRRFVCSTCGHSEAKWLGKCPECGEWNTLVETVVGEAKRSSTKARPVPLESMEGTPNNRIRLGIGELDRVLGGGLVPGSSILVGGPPGIGKSTLMLCVIGAIAGTKRCLYVSAEESVAQVSARAKRLSIPVKDASILEGGDLDAILDAASTFRPGILIVDSLQTVRSGEAGAVPGTVSQIKYCCQELSDWARRADAVVLFVAHITKEGSIAGPKSVEHMVDTVLAFDEAAGSHRYLRAAKNRFGATEEVGVFSMTAEGLVEVSDAASHFLERREGSPPAGVVVAAVYEGSRAFLVELQALTVPAKGGISRVFSDRIDSRRVSRTAAVLEKHLGISFSDQDIYVNVAGGLRIGEVGVELPLAVALYSARTDKIVAGDVAVHGEVTLAGEVRDTLGSRGRTRAARDQGIRRIVCPKPRSSEREAQALHVSTVREAVEAAFASDRR